MTKQYTFIIGIEGIYLEDFDDPYDDQFEAIIELTDDEYDQIRAAYVDYFWDDDDLSELFRDYLPELNRKICTLAEPFAVAKFGERAILSKGAWYGINPPKDIEKWYSESEDYRVRKAEEDRLKKRSHNL